MMDFESVIANHEDTTIERLVRQLAEECAELNHACIKYLRTIDDGDATPVTKEEALGRIFEEAADVSLVERVLKSKGFMDESIISDWIDTKSARWCRRLEIPNDVIFSLRRRRDG